MCGRFSQTQTPEAIAQAFQVAEVPALNPRYNIAPTQPVVTVLQPPDNKGRQLRMMRWGLIPSWAKDAKIGSKLINARAETVAEKPSFRSAFRKRRCLVVADGFYEWQQQAPKQPKQPFYFRLQDGYPFAFAGLWEYWQSPEGEEIQSCTFLTTQANELMRPIHNRMPVIVDSKDYDLWLDPDAKTPETLQPLLQPYPEQKMTAYPVSKAVNKPNNDSAECINSI